MTIVEEESNVQDSPENNPFNPPGRQSNKDQTQTTARRLQAQAEREKEMQAQIAMDAYLAH